MRNVTLVLQDGTKFHGKSFGYDAPVAGGSALGPPADSELAAFAPDRVDVDEILTIKD